MANDIATVLPDFTVKYQPAPIVISNEAQLKQAVSEYAAKYQDLVVTEETLADTKKVRAEMRKVVNQLDDNRKQVKRGYDQPLKDFEQRIKSLKGTVNQVIAPIDQGIKELEERQRQARVETVKATINEMAPNYGVDPEDVEIISEWLTKSISKKKLLDGIAGTMTIIKNEQDRIAAEELAVKKYAAANGQQPEGWISQVKAGVALTDIYERIDAAVMQQKEAAESRRKAAEAAAAVEKMKLQQYHEQTVDTETGEIVAAEPSLIETTLKISGTKQQLVALKKYMDETGIEYERLEV